MAVDLYPHQIDARDKLSNGKILWGDVGTGKSITAAAYYMKEEFPKDIYVITTAKKRNSLDWDGDFVKYGIGTRRDATVGGLLIVDSWNNLHKYLYVKNAFFIFDEQKVVGSGKWAKNFIKIATNNHWILLSATPGDVWLDYIPVFIANGFYKNRTEFMQEHVVFTRYAKFPKVDRYIGTDKLMRLRDSLLVEMPYYRHTTRHYVDVDVEFDCDLFNKVVKRKWHVFEERPLRDVAELFSVMRKVVNSDSSRLSAVRSLIKSHPKLIVFYNFNYELEALRSLSSEGEWISEIANRPSENDETGESSGSTIATAEELGSISTTLQTRESFAVAEWNGHKHQEIPDTDSWVYLVQYVAGAEGWNCTSTDAMVFYSLPYSYKNFHQAQGRIDRLNTPFTDLYYYIFKSKSVIDKAIWKALSTKKAFNESRFYKTR